MISRDHPEFVLERIIHKEKTGLIVDMRWSANGENFFIIKNKSITIYEFSESGSKNPPLKVKFMYEDRYPFSN